MMTITVRMIPRYTGSRDALMWLAIRPNAGGAIKKPTYALAI